MGSFYAAKTQWGAEGSGTHGTPVVADTLVLCPPAVVPVDRKPVMPADGFGYRADAVRAELHQIEMRDSLVVPNGYFQALPMLLSILLKGNITAAPVTGGKTDYSWTHTPSLTGANTQDAITLERGDNDQGYKAEYVMSDSLEFSGTVAQAGDASPVSLNAGLFGRQWTRMANMTAGVNPIAVEPIIAKLGQVYCNNTWATVGNTELALALRSFRVKIKGSLYPVHTGSTVRTFGGSEEGSFGGEMALTLHPTAGVAALYQSWNLGDAVTQTYFVFRLKFTGSTIPTATAHSWTFDMGGYLKDFQAIGQTERGTNLYTMTLQAAMDTTAYKILQSVVVTNVGPNI